MELGVAHVLPPGIIDHVSKNPVCRVPVVVHVEAELLHARPTVVLGKPRLDIASHLAGGHYVIKCRAGNAEVPPARTLELLAFG